jgi:F420-non-reducing hydrogenase iron-sulfur subunit
VEMYNMSSAQGQRFAEVAREMTEKIRSLGPSPVKARVQGVQGSRGPASISEHKPSTP